MRLIDADALKIRDISPSYWQVVDGLTEYDIEDAPTVDAVPVTRCKDCESHGKRTNMCDIWHHYTSPEGYCHRGRIYGQTESGSESK